MRNKFLQLWVRLFGKSKTQQRLEFLELQVKILNQQVGTLLDGNITWLNQGLTRDQGGFGNQTGALLINGDLRVAGCIKFTDDEVKLDVMEEMMTKLSIKSVVVDFPLADAAVERRQR
jgi:hypothetical protein